jgi:excisionase family DNA binding protein
MSALTTAQVMERFQIKSVDTAMELFRRKGSPAYKVGTGRGHWRVDEDDFKKYLQKESEKYKG